MHKTTPMVIVSGAGPTGLTLAAELAHAGIRCRVLERRRERVPWSRAFGLMPRTMELLDMRGAMDPFLEAGLPCMHPPLGDLRGHLDYGLLDTPFPYILILPQSKTEELLEKRAVEAGAEIVRNAEITGVRQDPETVHVQVRGPDRDWEEAADWVVGCDGVRSTVRDSVGIGFPGRVYDKSLVIVDAPLRKPPKSEVHARITRRGMVAVYPFGDGTFRLIILDRQRMDIPVEQPVTLAEATESIQGILGLDPQPYDPVWMSRFRSSQRHADRYRAGRVLLAGDAAHTHIPSGGQGLQVGIQDAMNLAWKLISEMRGRAPEWLLDSYEKERRPIAEATLRKTDVAFRFEIADNLPSRLARRLFMKSVRIKPLQIPVLKEFANFTLRYRPPREAGPTHRLTGTRLPDTTLHGPDLRDARLFELFRDQRFVLLDQTAEGRGAELVRQLWPDRVRAAHGNAPARRRLPELVLARPDGYVAWAGAGGDIPLLHAAATRWCGPADNPLA
ncbi:FAD-dependent monooxygenase [Streptomyces yerevanensis]|uniref:FAD-dependent monooxygenase n=1 Tax=Streptomyces yerevanensis TaxID=66378 RepID=UPI000ADD0412|nr:FAD-dependent monooxygenase [Streptomyces yerevanensis]